MAAFVAINVVDVSANDLARNLSGLHRCHPAAFDGTNLPSL
jgi:hypothetical protein